MKELAICGCARSGTSALTYALNQDRSTLITHETCCYIWCDKSQPFINQFRNMIQRSDRYFKSPFTSKGIEIESVMEKLPLSRELPTMINEMGYEVVGDKLPDYLYNLNLHTLLENKDVKLVVMVRDVRAFINSSMKEYNRGNRSQWAKATEKEAEDFWVHANSHLICQFFSIPMDRFCVIQYESSLNNTRGMIDKVSSMIDYQFNIPNLREVYTPVNAYSWKESLPGITQRLSNESKRIMELFGYEV